MNTDDQPDSGSLREIYLRAVEKKTPLERAAFLDGACGDNVAMRSKVEALLKENAEDSFLEKPAVEGITTLEVTPLSEGPGTEIGRYKLLQRIGEGGMGVVYMAEQIEPVTRKVALKIIKLGMDTKQVVARFEAERQALAMMDHPNIAKVLDAGATDTGRPYFVMELVRGVPITEYCDKNKLSTLERLNLFIPVCQAIQHAHQKGVIHRDIKPTNVMVTLHDGSAVPKVIDFGIAKATNQKLTEKTLFTNYAQMIGTPAYMSPEQAEMSGLDVDTRTDVYSLGVLLYELMTGTTPFPSKELLSLGYGEMQKVIAEKEPPKPSTRLSTMQNEERTVVAKNRSIEASALGKAFQGDLDWIVMKAMEKDRTHRYETVNGLVADIKRHLNNEPVSAAAPTFSYQFHKFVRRNRKYARAAAAVATLLIATTLVATWMAIRATQARRSEELARGAEQQAKMKAEQKQKEAEDAQAAESRQRTRAEGLLETMQLQRAGEQLDRLQTRSGAGYLVQVLRANPSNQVAAARLASVLMRYSGQPLTPPLRHEGEVTSAEFSPDGLMVVTASYDHTARVWDARTGQLLTPPLRHEDKVVTARFSPDGLMVVTAAMDHTARVWDARTGQPLTPPLRHEDKVVTARFSPDGMRVVTASVDRTAQVWDARTGQRLTPPLKHGGSLRSAEFSPDGLRVVTASWDKTARVWDARTGQPLTEPLRHEAGVSAAQFSPDGLWVVTASWDKTARVWDARTGEPVTPPLRHDASVSSLEISPDGLRVLTASVDKAVWVWDAHTGRVVTGPLRHDGFVSSARFSPDGLRVLTTSWDGTARVWDALTGQPLTQPMRHESGVISAEFSPDGLRVVTASFDKTARVWDARMGEPLPLRLPHDSDVYFAQFSPDGLRVVTACGDRTARIWDALTGRALAPPLLHDATVSSALFSPDGSRVVTASFDKTARVWDARNGQPITEPLRHENAVSCAQFSPDGLRVVTASYDKTARVWDAHSGQPVTEPLRHDGQVYYAEFSPDGLLVVTASYDKTARVWDARTGKPVTEPLQHESTVHSAQFSPDGLRVVTASEDKTARVWDARTGQPVTEPLRHEGSVYSARFSPDGLRVVTASDDKTARVWDARSGQPVTEPLRHDQAVNSARFSPDGLRVVTSSEDQTVRVWDARAGQPVTEPLRYKGNNLFFGAQFSPDGLRVLTSSDKAAEVWEIPPSATPVPEWFLDWAETRLDRRFTNGNATAAVEQGDRLRVRQLVAARTDTNYYTLLAQWTQADPILRTISPLARFTVQEYVRRRIAEHSLEGLHEVLRLNPTNNVAWVRLSELQFQQNTNHAPELLAEAEFSARQALRLDASNGAAWCALGAAQLRSGQLPEASQSTDQALRLSPDDWRTWELKGDLQAQQRHPAEAVEAYWRGASVLVTTNIAAVQVRAGLLRKSLHESAVWNPASTEGSSGRQALLRQAEELAKTARSLPVTELGDALLTWQRLAEAFWASNDTAGAELLVNGFIGGLERFVAANPGDTIRLKGLAQLRLWTGQTNQYVAECRKLLEMAATSTEPTTLDRAAKACLVQPQQDPELLKKAVDAGHKCVKVAGDNHPFMGYFRTTSAMASLREGKPGEAESMINLVLSQPVAEDCKVLAFAIRALARGQLGRRAEARADLEAVERSLPNSKAPPTLSPVLLQPDLMAAAFLSGELKALLAAPSAVPKP